MPWIPDPNEQPGQEKPTAISLPETDTQRPEESQTNDRIGDLTQPAEVAAFIDAAPTSETDDHHVCAASMRQTFGASGQKGARGGKTEAMNCHVESAREFGLVESQDAGVARVGLGWAGRNCPMPSKLASWPWRGLLGERVEWQKLQEHFGLRTQGKREEGMRAQEEVRGRK